MGAQKIVLPPDSTGKAMLTQERTVTGPGVVQVEYVIPISERVFSGAYLYALNGTVQASAHTGTGTGFWYLYNPAASGILLALDYCIFMSSEATALATVTAPRINLTGFTFTGTPGGTTIAPEKVDSAFGANVAVFMSTQVTSVVTLTKDFASFLPTVVQSSSSGGPAGSTYAAYQPEERLRRVVHPGEGIVCWQPDAGTAADTRKVITNIAWSEYTVP
ncbi:MAG TPA: hypothetical protein VEO01_38085 [Pseudonocardiaceae bacterium]|nr:hypothetical protein [Pseudonocardiaceae bacterium]